jgi:hypothetical protein
MRLRRALVAALLAALVAAVPAGAKTVGHVRVAIDSDASFPDYALSASRQQLVVLNAWQVDRLRALKQANPDVKVLVYKNLSFLNQFPGPGGLSASGVSYAEAEQQPQWFLTNTSGQRFSSGGYRYLWAADVGDPAYQRRWAHNVTAELRSQGWDGVFMDDANPTIKYHYPPAQVAKYPSDRAYGGATRQALAAIGPRVRAAGKLAVANIGAWSEYYWTGVDWLRFLDGAMEEMFLKSGSSADAGYMSSRFHDQLNQLKEAQRQGKAFIGITHSSASDRRAALFGYATMLLGSEGNSYFALHEAYSDETWFPEYDYDLGRPLGPEREDPVGVRRREFERGLVLVNPTLFAKAVSLDGAYGGLHPGGTSSVTIPPLSGSLLIGDGSVAAGAGGRGALMRLLVDPFGRLFQTQFDPVGADAPTP